MMKRGFSLIETIAVIGVTVMALIALTNLFLIFNTTYGYQQAVVATAGSAGAAMNALGAAVLPADRVLASRDFSGTAYASATTTLVLELPAADSSGNMLPGAYDYIVFYLSDGTLYRLIEAAPGSVRVSNTKQLSSAIGSLAFTYDDSDFARITKVSADLTTRAFYKQQAVRSHLTGQWYLRNLQISL